MTNKVPAVVSFPLLKFETFEEDSYINADVTLQRKKPVSTKLSIKSFFCKKSNVFVTGLAAVALLLILVAVAKPRHLQNRAAQLDVDESKFPLIKYTKTAKADLTESINFDENIHFKNLSIIVSVLSTDPKNAEMVLTVNHININLGNVLITQGNFTFRFNDFSEARLPRSTFQFHSGIFGPKEPLSKLDNHTQGEWNLVIKRFQGNASWTVIMEYEKLLDWFSVEEKVTYSIDDASQIVPDTNDTSCHRKCLDLNLKTCRAWVFNPQNKKCALFKHQPKGDRETKQDSGFKVGLLPNIYKGCHSAKEARTTMDRFKQIFHPSAILESVDNITDIQCENHTMDVGGLGFLWWDNKTCVVLNSTMEYKVYRAPNIFSKNFNRKELGFFGTPWNYLGRCDLDFDNEVVKEIYGDTNAGNDRSYFLPIRNVEISKESVNSTVMATLHLCHEWCYKNDRCRAAMWVYKTKVCHVKYHLLGMRRRIGVTTSVLTPVRFDHKLIRFASITPTPQEIGYKAERAGNLAQCIYRCLYLSQTKPTRCTGFIYVEELRQCRMYQHPGITISKGTNGTFGGARHTFFIVNPERREEINLVGNKFTIKNSIGPLYSLKYKYMANGDLLQRTPRNLNECFHAALGSYNHSGRTGHLERNQQNQFGNCFTLEGYGRSRSGRDHLVFVDYYEHPLSYEYYDTPHPDSCQCMASERDGEPATILADMVQGARIDMNLLSCFQGKAKTMSEVNNVVQLCKTAHPQRRNYCEYGWYRDSADSAPTYYTGCALDRATHADTPCTLDQTVTVWRGHREFQKTCCSYDLCNYQLDE